MNKKGQAAMEFLMTYGWAILVVIAAIAALAYFGVLDPSRLLPEKCEFPPGMDCIDKAAFDIDNSEVSIALRNNVGFKIHITDVNSSQTTNGCVVTDWAINGGASQTETPINNNDLATVVIDCSSIEAGKFSETFTVTYRNNETTLVHHAVGVVRGRV
ncbi:hypothetical protein JW930_03695 [Candidatus Woesearchaeota archaeon]|nr:hypothetical protein [Candidatus Woesearchaeota archaeon]